VDGPVVLRSNRGYSVRDPFACPAPFADETAMLLLPRPAFYISSQQRGAGRRRPGPHRRAELLLVFVLPDHDLAEMIGAFSANPKTRTFAELLIGSRVAAF